MFPRAAAAVLLAALLPGLPAAQAQERVVPRSSAEVKQSFAPIVAAATPAVVNVYAAKIVETRSAGLDFFGDPILREFFGDRDRNRAAPRRQRVSQSLGSGVIVAEDGIVVTNNHVIEGADEVRIALSDKREFECEVLIRDSRNDLAVLKVKGSAAHFSAIELADSDDLQVGDLVLAIGNPFGLGQTVTSGIVSAIRRVQIKDTDQRVFIQTDAAINQGNSGGALLDMDGRLIGINTAIFSRSGGSDGIGFAIPVNLVRAVVAAAKRGDKTVKRPYLGAKLQAVTPEIAETLNLERPTGVLVASVEKASPAAEAGLKENDLVLEIDGKGVDDMESLAYRIATKDIGSKVALTVVREGKPIILNMAIAAPPEVPARDPVKIAGLSPFQGATVINLSPAVADEMGLESSAEGVVIAEIDRGSVAARIGLQRGDVILGLNDRTIGSTRDLDKLTKTPQRFWDVTIRRGGDIIQQTFRG